MRNYHTIMFNIVVLLFVLSPFLSYDYSIPTMTVSSGLQPVQAQETSPDSFSNLTGIWERDDGAQVYITQTGSDVIGTYYPSPTTDCEGFENSETDFLFKGTLEGNEVIGEESTWCYYGSSNPDENGLFIDPFRVTISDNGNTLTLFIVNRFTGEEMSEGYSKISMSEGEEPSPTDNQGPPGATQPGNTFNSTLSQAQSTVDQFGNTFTTTLSEAENSMSILQQNNLPTMILFAGLVVAAIGGTAAYAKSKSSKRSQHKGGNVAVITRGGIQ